MTNEEEKTPPVGAELWYLSRGVFAALVESDITFSFAGLQKVLDAHEADVRHKLGEKLKEAHAKASQDASAWTGIAKTLDENTEGYLRGLEVARVYILNKEDLSAHRVEKGLKDGP